MARIILTPPVIFFFFFFENFFSNIFKYFNILESDGSFIGEHSIKLEQSMEDGKQQGCILLHWSSSLPKPFFKSFPKSWLQILLFFFPFPLFCPPYLYFSPLSSRFVLFFFHFPSFSPFLSPIEKLSKWTWNYPPPPPRCRLIFLLS